MRLSEEDMNTGEAQKERIMQLITISGMYRGSKQETTSPTLCNPNKRMIGQPTRLEGVEPPRYSHPDMPQYKYQETHWM